MLPNRRSYYELYWKQRNELQKLVENKLKGGSISFEQENMESSKDNKDNNINNNNNNYNKIDSNNLHSSPMTIDDQEFFK